MRTLRDFLIAESLLVEKDDGFEIPSGYAKIDARGRLSNQAKDVLGIVNLKSGSEAAKTKDGSAAIRSKMGIGSIPNEDPIKFLRLFFKQKTPINEYIAQGKEDTPPDRIILDLKGQWMSIGGKNKWKSSLKVIKFWITSVMQAYGINEPIEKVGVLQDKAQNKIMVYKRPK